MGRRFQLRRTFGGHCVKGGDQILTVSDDKSVCLWAANTGERITRLEDFGGSVTSSEYNADGSRFVTVVNSIVHVWDTETLDLTATPK